MQKENKIIETPMVESLVLFKKDNNIDGKDNLNLLPGEKAVYAISGRINGEPANYRMVAITDDLQKAVKHNFSNQEERECLKNFMQSIKIKMLVYRLLPGMSPEEMDRTLKEWEKLYSPECNDKLNEVF